MIDAIMESGDRAASIVSNMLSFSHQGESTPSACDIPALMDRSIELASADYDLEKRYDFRQRRRRHRPRPFGDKFHHQRKSPGHHRS